MNLTKTDYLKLAACGITSETVASQIEKLSNGPDILNIKGACVIDNGIVSIKREKKEQYISQFKKQVSSKNITMFTPASGAATRMFKHLINPESNPDLYQEFVENITKFAFYPEVKDAGNNSETVSFILNNEGLNYASLPKALISFHKYENEVRKAIDDQIVEGIGYLNLGEDFTFHFTISAEHEKIVSMYLSKTLPNLEQRFGAKIKVEFSFQEKHTDTVALTDSNDLVRNEFGEVLTRPGGHGALIHNLNSINSDLIFVKNIDNIAREEFHADVVEHKKVIGSYLLDIQNQVFGMLKELDSVINQGRLLELVNWVLVNLKLTISPDIEELRKTLNKPIRVCGMVKNEGKAGGGPFWVDNGVQIVESAQMDLENPEVQEILKDASHFNPVDLVCGVKNYQGEKFNLIDFVDDSTFFVSEKSYQGQDIKVLELPGLWNGAMANWLTFFVEVPVSTFNPVKTVNDLLLMQHCKDV